MKGSLRTLLMVSVFAFIIWKFRDKITIAYVDGKKVSLDSWFCDHFGWKKKDGTCADKEKIDKPRDPNSRYKLSAEDFVAELTDSSLPPNSAQQHYPRWHGGIGMYTFPDGIGLGGLDYTTVKYIRAGDIHNKPLDELSYKSLMHYLKLNETEAFADLVVRMRQKLSNGKLISRSVMVPKTAYNFGPKLLNTAFIHSFSPPFLAHQTKAADRDDLRHDPKFPYYILYIDGMKRHIIPWCTQYLQGLLSPNEKCSSVTAHPLHCRPESYGTNQWYSKPNHSVWSDEKAQLGPWRLMGRVALLRYLWGWAFTDVDNAWMKWYKKNNLHIPMSKVVELQDVICKKYFDMRGSDVMFSLFVLFDEHLGRIYSEDSPHVLPEMTPRAIEARGAEAERRRQAEWYESLSWIEKAWQDIF